MPVTGATQPGLWAEARSRVKVLLPLPLAGAYDYRLPPGLTAAPGDFVTVPLGGRMVEGVVWGEADRQGVAASRLKDVEAVLPVPPLPAMNRSFIDWMAAYVLAPPGSVLKMAMSAPGIFEPPRSRLGYRLVANAEITPFLRMTPERRRVLALLEDGLARAPADLAREAGVGTAVPRGLAEAGLLQEVALDAEINFDRPDPDLPAPSLSPFQAEALAGLARKETQGGFSVSVIDGVTGSGKTEVYFEAIAEALRQDRQVLVLLPEIALSSQWLTRFADRFGCNPAEWHSDLTPARRRATWRAVAEGRVRVIVGARSALHLPLPELGLIVVDEEHEAAFKQEEGVIYHARDMAVARARFANCPILLVSATPSLETLANVQAGRYGLVHMPERHGGADLPDIKLIDLRRHKPKARSFLSEPLRKALAETLEAGDQALLFLNRRGYAPLTLCDHCGHRMQCPRCTAWLVEHRFLNRLICHHCGYAEEKPQECPECGEADSFRPVGPGVERLAEEAAALHPQARIEMATSDTLFSPAAAAEFVRRMTEREVDIVIGTQIVAKGYHFPHLTLVGVVDADLGLHGGDLRAAERTWQLLQQVAGRVGRAEKKGHVWLQTANPDAAVMQALAANDRDGFLAAEEAERRLGGWPPFGRLAAIVVSGPEADAVDALALHLAHTAPHGPEIEILGPAEPPLALLRGRHRRRLLVKTGRNQRIQALIQDWLAPLKLPASLKLTVDIDPYSFM